MTKAEVQNNPNLGGACGEIHAMINKGKKLLNPLGQLRLPCPKAKLMYSGRPELRVQDVQHLGQAA